MLSRSILAEQVWGIAFDSESNVIDVTVSHLRGKPGDPPFIHTVGGFGYTLRGGEEP